MKIFIIVITGIILSASNHCQAQNWDEWFQQKKTQRKYLLQQIAALHVYLDYMKKGYEIAHQGLGLISDIKQGKFNLHKDYFASLDAVNPVLSNSSKVTYALVLGSIMQKDILALLDDCRNKEDYTESEVEYLSNVYTNLASECIASMDNLISVITADEMQMKDDERLTQINALLVEMQNMYAFTRTFGNSARLLALQRHREQTGITVIEQVHKIQPQ